MQNQARVQNKTAHFQALLDSLAELVFRVNRDGVIQEFFIPPKWEIGLNRKIVSGKPLWHFFEPEIQKKWIQQWEDKIRMMEEGDLFQSFEYELPYPSGPKHFEPRLALFGDEGVMVTVRETTPTVRAYQKLECFENRYRAFLVSHPDFILRLNLDGYFLDIHAPDENQLVKPIQDQI